MAWVEMVHSQSGSFLTVDTIVFKQAGQIGVQFKQEFVADKYQVRKQSVNNIIIKILSIKII